MKLDIEKLYESYIRTGSVHRAGDEFGLHGESVRRALMASGKRIKNSKWKPEEVAMLKEEYESDRDLDLMSLAKKLGRTYAAVAVKGGRYGFSHTRGKSPITAAARANMSLAQKEVSKRPEVKARRAKATSDAFKRNGHPRGMLGKHHTQKTKDAISAAHIGIPVPRERVMRQLKTREAKYGTLSPPRYGTTWSSSWRTIGDKRKYYRSSWEANYARYLEQQKQAGLIKDWHHECERFWFDKDVKGCVSYLPDFKVTNNDDSIEFHEIKGWMDDDSATKIQRMAEFHPTVKLVVRGSEWYNANKKHLSQTVPEWEKSKRDPKQITPE